MCHSSLPEGWCNTSQGPWEELTDSLVLSSTLCDVALRASKAWGQSREQGRTSEAGPKEQHETVLQISNEKVRLTF